MTADDEIENLESIKAGIEEARDQIGWNLARELTTKLDALIRCARGRKEQALAKGEVDRG